MKKTCVSFLAAIVMLLAGCGRKDKIGICFRNADAGVTPQFMQRLTDSLKANDCQVQSANGADDQARQNGQILHFLEEGCDLLIVEPVMTAQAQDIVAAAGQKDVPVIFLNYEPQEEVLGSENVCYIGSDLSTPGSVLGKMLNNLPDTQPRYLIISGSADHIDANSWTQACCRSEQGKCVAVEYGDWSARSGRRIARRYLARHTDAPDVLICMGDEMMLGALEAVKEMQAHVSVIGIGAQRQALLQVAQGQLSGVVCPDISALTKSVSEAACGLLDGQKSQKRVTVDYVAVTKENVQEFLK